MLNYCYKILLLHDKKIHLTSNVIMAYADMFDIVQFILTSRVVYCLYLYKFFSGSRAKRAASSNMFGSVSAFSIILSERP